MPKIEFVALYFLNGLRIFAVSSRRVRTFSLK